MGIPDFIGVTFNSYYGDTSCIGNFCNTLPYIINSNELVEWYPEINSTLISDFIKTNSIKPENGIIFEYGYPQAGVPGFKDALQLWEQIYPFLQIIATVGGVIEFIKFIKSIFRKNVPLPHDFISYLYKRDYWNHYELAKALSISDEYAKNLLVAFGYKWDNSKKIYIIDAKAKKDIHRIKKKIQFFDV